MKDWLCELDAQFVVYAPHLKELGFNSRKMMKCLKLTDFVKTPCKIPAPHRRMIMNAVLKMQTPESKVREQKLDTPDSDEIVNAERKKIACYSTDRLPKRLPRCPYETELRTKKIV